LSRVICACLFAGLVAGAALDAAPARRKQSRKPTDEFRFGVGVQIVSPIGTLNTWHGVKTGFGASILGEMALNNNMGLRARADYNVFGEGTYITDTAKSKANAMTAFADFIYSFSSRDEGFYVFGGFGMVGGKIEHKYPSRTTSFNANGLGYTFGAGYNIDKNMGLEASLVQAAGIVDEAIFSDFNWMQVSFKYRF